MTTLTLTPLPDDAAVRILITADRVVRSLTRSDANGSAAVRTLPGILPFYPPTTETRRNLLPNPRFLGSTTVPSGTYQLFSTNGTFANAAGVFTSAAPAGFPNAEKNGIVFDVTIPATTGKLAAAITYTRAGPADAVIKLEALDAGGAVLASGLARNTAGGTLTVATGTPTGTAVRYRLSLYIENTTGAATTGPSSTAFSKPVVEAGAAAGTYFDGGSLPPAVPETLAHSWAGTPHNSASIESTYAGTLILTDYEPASGVVSYTPKGEITAGAAATVDFALPGPWIFCPVMPAYSIRLETLDGYSAGGDSHSTIIDGSGRPDPIVIMREMGTRAGTIDLYAGTYRNALDLVKACSRGEVLMLRQPEHDGMDMYFTVRRYAITTRQAAGDRTVFGVTADYVEVARPAGYRAGATGWTFADVKAAAPTFADLTSMFATFEDLRLNQRIN